MGRRRGAAVSGRLTRYGGNYRPEQYLDPAVRRGISTFALLTDADAARTGLQRLAADIRSGRIAAVRARYGSADGDYAFVVADRSG